MRASLEAHITSILRQAGRFIQSRRIAATRDQLIPYAADRIVRSYSTVMVMIAFEGATMTTSVAALLLTEPRELEAVTV